MSGRNSQAPTFSVIMPVYNHVRYVGEAIESVLCQSFDNWELIVVDDGSTDGSADAIAELLDRHDASAGGRQRIALLHQANLGPAAARNAALDSARGPWLAYLDSDDVWYPDTLQHYADTIEAHPQAAFIHGYRHRLNPDGSVTELPGEFQQRPTGTAELFGRMYLSHLCVCYRRSLLDVAGRYDAALRSCEDYELYLRLSLHCRFEPLGLATGLRRRHQTNLSRQTGASRMLEAEVLRRFAEHQGGGEVLDEVQVRRRLGRLYYAAARQYFKARCFSQAAAAARQACRYRMAPRCVALRFMAGCLRPIGIRDGGPTPRL